MVTDKRVNPSNVSLCAHAKLDPGSGIGYHEHYGESEIYYILSGKGLYDDNGTKREVTVGDVTYTPHGQGHSLENIGDCVLEFMAIINTDER
ncbi:MAG: cupin domain-containing protein [Clostridia bacterium]|nr:cupin domain-containing protein [Clostridia bacterium]